MICHWNSVPIFSPFFQWRIDEAAFGVKYPQEHRLREGWVIVIYWWEPPTNPQRATPLFLPSTHFQSLKWVELNTVKDPSPNSSNANAANVRRSPSVVSKGSPGGIIGGPASSLGWKSTVLLSVPWGRNGRHQIPSLLYMVAFRKKRKNNFIRLSFRAFSLVMAFDSMCLWADYLFLCAVSSPLSITLSKTLCLLKSDMFVAATWQGGIISRVLLTISLLLQGIATANLLITHSKPQLILSPLSSLPYTLCVFPPSLTSSHLSLTLSSPFLFPLISQSLTSVGLAQSIFPGCLILLSDKSVWVTPHLTPPSLLSSLSSVVFGFQGVSRRPHWSRADRWAPPLYSWHVFSTAGPAREGEHGQSGPHGWPALTIHRQHSQGPTLAWPRPSRSHRDAGPPHWPGEVQCRCLPAAPVLWKWQDKEGCASAEGNSCSGGASRPSQIWSPPQGLWRPAQHLLWQGQWQQGGHQELWRHPSPRPAAEKDQWHGSSRAHHR